MAVARDYRHWDPSDPLDPDVEATLAFLDQLTDERNITGVVACIDRYGVVVVEVPIGPASVWLQVGDGWNRVIWTVPAGRSYEWKWNQARGPQQVSALARGHGRERLTHQGRRRVTEELLVDGQRLAEARGVRRRLLRRLRFALESHEQPAS